MVVGGAKKVRNLEDVAAASFKISDDIEGSMNRMTLKTASSGSVSLRFNVCHHNRYNFVHFPKIRFCQKMTTYSILRAIMEKMRDQERDKIHKQKFQRFRETKKAKELAGPDMLATTDGKYMNRFTTPDY